MKLGQIIEVQVVEGGPMVKIKAVKAPDNLLPCKSCALDQSLTCWDVACNSGLDGVDLESYVFEIVKGEIETYQVHSADSQGNPKVFEIKLEVK